MSTAFRLQTYPELLAKAFSLARVLFGEEVDLNVGSFTRNILEILATLDAEQYVQIAKLLDLNSPDQLLGDDCDEYGVLLGSDFDDSLKRRPARTSLVQLSVSDGSLIVRSTLAGDIFIGAMSFSVPAGTEAAFPVSGAVVLERSTERSEEIVYTRSGAVFTVVSPNTGVGFNHPAGGEVLRVSIKSVLAASVSIGASSATLATGTGAAWSSSGTVIFERGTVREEKLAFTRVGDVLTLGGTTTFAHAILSSVHQSTTGADRSIAAGGIAYVPATESNKQVNFRVSSGGVLLDGDITSGLIAAESQDAGQETLVGASTITKWVSPPFVGATVTNPVAAVRGSNRESDSSYMSRLKLFSQKPVLVTPLAVEANVSNRTDPVTNQTVVFAQIVEPITPGMSLLYISDGSTTFTLTQTQFVGRDVLIADADLGDKRGKLSQFGPFALSVSPESPRLFRSVERGVATLVGVNFLEDNTKSMTVNAFSGMFLKTDDNQFYAITSNTAIRFTVTASGATPSSGSYSVYDLNGAPLVPGTDFQFSQSTGDVELATALVAHDGLVAASDGAVGAYTYTTGLGAYVQRVVNGDPSDLSEFPGLRAAGCQILVTAPTVVAPAFQIKLVAAAGFVDSDLRADAGASIVGYVNSLGIGANVILSEIVRVLKSMPGVADVEILLPVANVPVPDGQMARITTANIDFV